jgi:hypothetical protein
MGRANGLPVVRESNSLGSLCAAQSGLDDGGEVCLMAQPGDRSDRWSPRPPHSTQAAIDCDGSVVWVRSSSCGSEY